MKNKKLKNKIEKITLGYIDAFRDEYRLVVAYIEGEREKNKNKFGSISGEKVLQRKIYEIPETLNKLFIKELTPEELVLMKDGADGKDFAHWFAKRFPEFSGGTHV